MMNGKTDNPRDERTKEKYASQYHHTPTLLFPAKTDDEITFFPEPVRFFFQYMVGMKRRQKSETGLDSCRRV